MRKVTKIIVILLALVVGYVVWETKYDPRLNITFYVAYKYAQESLFHGQQFHTEEWGRGCKVIFEYNSLAPDEWERKRRYINYLEKVWPCEKGKSEGISQAIIVRKNGKTYQIFIPFKKGSDTDPEIVGAAKEVANDLCGNVFDSQPVDIHMCDDFFNTNRVVSAQRRIQ